MLLFNFGIALLCMVRRMSADGRLWLAIYH